MGTLALKVLGAIDLITSIVFLSFVFGMTPYLQLVLFCAGLLLIKGMFMLTGDVLSIIDLFSSICLIISLIFLLPTIILWVCAFLLLAKGIVSFV